MRTKKKRPTEAATSIGPWVSYQPQNTTFLGRWQGGASHTYMNQAKKKLLKAKAVIQAKPQAFGHYRAIGYKQDGKGHMEQHCRVEGICLLDNPLQAAMRQHQELQQCDRVSIAVQGGGT